MLKNDIDIKDAELLFNKICAYHANNAPDKLLYRRILKEGVTKFHAPYYVSWEVTAACNLRCKHCCFAGHDYNSVNDISEATAMSVVNELINMDVIKIMLTGGEPLMRPDIFNIIEKLKSHNIIIELTSNALLVDNSAALKLGKLLNPACDYVQVSVDGAKEATHELTRGKGTFLKTIEGIKNLLSNGVNVTINCVVTDKNQHEMTELYALACTLGVKKITFTRVFAEYNSGLLPDDNELFRETIELLKNEQPETEIELRLFSIPELAVSEAFSSFAPNTVNLDANIMCHKWEKLHIRKDGEVFLCLHASNQNLFSLGNIKNNSLEEILENRLENPLFGERFVTDVKCKKCAFVSLCKSGCPVNAYLKNGDINTSDSSCLV